MVTKAKSKSVGFFSRLGMSAKQWFRTFVNPAKRIDEEEALIHGYGATTVATLLSAGRRQARTRQAIYTKWSEMEGDPIISTALSLLVTAALGGHETSGELVFVETAASARDDKQLTKLVDEISATLSPLFNRIAFQIAYTASAYGDAYARVYADKSGIVDLYIDELVRPPLVQPYERGSRTVGYVVYTGEQNHIKLTCAQMARLRMPRTQWIPQYGVLEKSLKIRLTDDETEGLPILPAVVGGSLLYNAEDPYDKLIASLLGLVGQRWLDSIDEQILSVNMEATNRQQRDDFLRSLIQMVQYSKQRAENAVKSGEPVLERIRHIIPVFNDKQLTTIGSANGGQSGRAANITIDDIMLHARMLAGALGVDLSLIDFADQLAGGLGEGGFFRVSAQMAERARVIRVALSDFFDQLIDIHTLNKYGVVFEKHQRPWRINFYGSISALEAEKQRTRTETMNAGMLLAQSMQMLKEMGANKDIMYDYLINCMGLDDAQSKLYSTIVENTNEAGQDEFV